LGGGSALLANALTFDTKIASTPTIGSLAWNAVNKEWQWSRGVGTPQIAMKFVGNESNNYAGPGTWIAAFTPGTLMGGDANSGNPHYFGMSTAKPSGTWHTQGSTQIVSNASPGAMGAWYSVGGSSSLVGVLNGTTLEVQQEIDNLPLPTLAAGGTGYASAAVTGTLTGALPGCTTQPVLAVTASAAGALTGITSVTTKGVCPPAATFTGTIALTNLTMPSVVGEIFPGDPVTGVGVTPGTTIVSGSGLAWVVTPSQTVGPVAMTAGALPTSSTAWTPGGALLAGTGAIVNLVWQQALTVTSSVLSGPPGLHQLLTGTSIVANTHIISGSGNFWGLDQTYASPLGPETITGQSWYPAMAVSNDPINPDFTAVALRSGSASNKDLTGRITLSGGAATYTLTGIYATPPDCVTADVTTPANSNSVLESTTVLTFSGTGTDTLKWVCAGRN
jgi:hypothetical protein